MCIFLWVKHFLIIRLCFWSCYLPFSVPQMTRETIVPRCPPPQDRVEAAVTQKSSPHYAHSTARWRTSPLVTISLSNTGLPSKGMRLRFFVSSGKNYILSREMKGESNLFCFSVYLFLHFFVHSLYFTHTGLCQSWRGFVSEGTWGRRSDKLQREPHCSESPLMP